MKSTLSELISFVSYIKEAESFKELIENILYRVRYILKADFSLIGIWDENDKKIELLRYDGMEYIPSWPVWREDITAEAYRKREVIICDNYSDYEFAKDELKGVLGPVLCCFIGEVMPKKLAVFEVARFSGAVRFSQEEIDLFNICCKFVYCALWQFYMKEFEKKTKRVEEFLIEAVKRMLEEEEEELKVVNVIVEEIVKIFDAQYAAFHKWDDKKKMLIPIIAYGFDFQLPPAREGEGVAGLAFKEKRSVLVKYIAHDERFIEDPVIKIVKNYVSSAMSVPLKIDDTYIGTLSVGRGKYKRSFTEDELRTLTLFGSIVEVMLKNAKAREREKKQQEYINKAQKLEAIGTLAGGIAHDFNNILGAIIGLSELALFRIKDDTVKHYLSMIIEKADHGSKLVRQILDFARRRPADKELFDLGVFVKEFVKLLRRTFPPDIDIRFETKDKGGFFVYADPSQIDQLLMNLCINAKDAMPDGGSLIIRIYKKSISDHETIKPGSYVVLEVEDNGCGMEKEVLERAFEPFFTTKSETGGTGLGLSQVYGIVKKHKGYIFMESEPGKGTKVVIFLPEAQAGYIKDYVKDVEIPKGRNEHVLVVDDDASSVFVARELLELLNYKTFGATDPYEALKIVEGERIDAAIIDVVMPKMGGIELYRNIRKIRPECRIVFTSGYGMSAELEDFVRSHNIAFVSKPFTLEILASALKKVLQRGV